MSPSVAAAPRLGQVPVRHNDEDVLISTKTRAGGGHLVVFLHGWGCAKDSFDFAYTAEALAGYSLCAVDLPGHGDSGVLAPASYSLQSYADIVRDVVGRLAYDRVSLVCHSMGGAVGLLASLEMPDLDSFVNIEGNLVAEDCGLVSRQTAEQSETDWVTGGFDRFVGGLRSSPRTDLRAWGRWCAACDPWALHQSARSLVEWSDSDKLTTYFRDITARAYIYGSENTGLEQYLLPRLDGTAIRHIHGAGHFPMMTNPGACYPAVADLLAASAGARSRATTGS